MNAPFRTGNIHLVAPIMSDASSNGEHAGEMKGGAVESGVYRVDDHHVENGFEMRNRASKLRGTEADEHDMEVLGRKQQLNASRVAPPVFAGQSLHAWCSATLTSFPFLVLPAPL